MAKETFTKRIVAKISIVLLAKLKIYKINCFVSALKICFRLWLNINDYASLYGRFGALTIGGLSVVFLLFMLSGSIILSINP